MKKNIKKIFLDIETTGLYPDKGDKIIEIFCLESFKNKLTKRFFHVYLKPDKLITKENYNIHGISNKFLFKKKLFKDIVFDFLKFIKDSYLIIHNSKFDLSFINKELNILKIKNIENYCFKVIDSLKIARENFPRKRNSLISLCKRFNINIKEFKLHRAFSDCFLLFKVFKYINIKNREIKFFKKLKKKKFKKKLILNNIITKASKKDIKMNKKFFN